jgi:ATP-binding cassette subfamily G (WHITE) protein 2
MNMHANWTLPQVMTVVRAFAEQGVTICATIHSPSAYAFNLFDNLLYLSKGQVIYFGANGAPAINWVRHALLPLLLCHGVIS